MAKIIGSNNQNYLSGTKYNDSIYGFGGADKIYGWGGNDSLYGGVGNDVLDGGTGNDKLYGEGGDDILSGGSGLDTMIGGTGNDQYYVDYYKDIVIENQNEGIDTVYAQCSYIIGNNLENLILTGKSPIKGFGNTLDNIVTGNSSNNIIYGKDGNDTLDGGYGADTLYGGKGDDIYYEDSSSDKLIEYYNEGVDTVLSKYSYILGNNLENLTLNGNSGIKGIGNSLDNIITGNECNNYLYGVSGNDHLIGAGGNDTLIGGNGNDILDGNTGQDLMKGGTGDDFYYIDNITDIVSEYSSQGNDTVLTTVSYYLSDNVENLTLIGANNIDGDGNSIGNTIIGNIGNNILSGEAGNDIIIGDVNYGQTSDNPDLPDDEDLILIAEEDDSSYDGSELTSGNDTLIGGAGNDTLIGGEMDDIYAGYLNPGFDSDTIDDIGGENDLLNIKGFNLSDVEFYSGDIPDSLVIHFLNSSDEITIEHYFSDIFGHFMPGDGYIETISFKDQDISFLYIQDNIV